MYGPCAHQINDQVLNMSTRSNQNRSTVVLSPVAADGPPTSADGYLEVGATQTMHPRQAQRMSMPRRGTSGPTAAMYPQRATEQTGKTRVKVPGNIRVVLNAQPERFARCCMCCHEPFYCFAWPFCPRIDNGRTYT